MSNKASTKNHHIDNNCKNLKTQDQRIPFFTEFSKEQTLKDAARNVGETPEKVRKGLQVMRDYMKKHNLRGPDDDDFLLMFLRVKKFRYEDSCKQLSDFYKCMKFGMECGGAIDYDAVKTILENNIVGILPHRDSQGRLMMFYRPGATLSEGLKVEDTANTAIFLILQAIKYPSTQTRGVAFILDCKCLSVREMTVIQTFGMLLVKIVNGAPVRISRSDCINSPRIFQAFFRVFRIFMPRKLIERVHTYGSDTSALFEHYDESLIPDDFGGTGGPLNNDHVLDKLDAYIDDAQKLQDKLAM